MTKPILDENTDIKKVKFNSYNFYTDNILTEAFIEKFNINYDWEEISAYQKLSEAFIEKYQNKVDWIAISGHQILSEEFILKHKDKIHWCEVSRYQKLSNAFIAKYINRLHFLSLKENKYLDQEFIKKLTLLIDEKNYEELSNKFVNTPAKADWVYNPTQQLSPVEENLLKQVNDLNEKVLKLEKKLAESKCDNQIKTFF